MKDLYKTLGVAESADEAAVKKAYRKLAKEFHPDITGDDKKKTERFKEFRLPGEKPTPYALGIDADHKVWYSSEWMDVIGRLDPTTGEVVEFPFPHAENTMREFTLDAKGRFWYGSPANDRVGYFYLSGK